jgi:hypothetical protein
MERCPERKIIRHSYVLCKTNDLNLVCKNRGIMGLGNGRDHLPLLVLPVVNIAHTTASPTCSAEVDINESRNHSRSGLLDHEAAI